MLLQLHFLAVIGAEPLTLTTCNDGISLLFDPAGAITGTRLGSPKAPFQRAKGLTGGVGLRAFRDGGIESWI